jgi:L-fuculose-phosphate aldolase
MNESQLREQICEIGRRMYARNFVAASDGNISCRLDDGLFLCTPTMVSKGFMQPPDICTVDAQGKQLDGDRPRTSEILLHLEIYRQMPDVNAVCHAHPPHATAFAVAGIAPPTGVLQEAELFLGEIPLAAYETPGSADFARTILPHLRNRANTILLANHGAVACDATLEKAYWHLETLDTYCQILLLTRQLGNIQHISPQKLDELLQLKRRMGIADRRNEG